MIVTCERCQTRFELEDGKLPPAGARVRCSKCRFSFFVKPSSPAEGETQVVAGGAPAPQPKAGKKGAAPAPEDATRVMAKPAAGAASAGRAEGGDEESDWQFNEEPQRKPSGARRAPVSPLREFLPPAREEPPSLEQLGDPESWDLVGNDEAGEVTVTRLQPEVAPPAPARPEPASPAARPAPSAPSPAAAPAPAPAPAAPPARASAPSAAPAPAVISVARAAAAFEEPEEAPASPGAQPLAWGIRAAGWAATLTLIGLLARASLAPPHSTAAAPASTLRSGVFVVRDVGVRRLENVFGERLLVVSGRVANDGDQPLAPATGLRLALLGEDGAELPGASVVAAAAPGEDRLREQGSQDLLADRGWRSSVLAWTPIAAHASSDFAAVVFDPPASASRFRLELTPPPPQPPPPAPAPPPEAPASEATSASPASPPPSSE